MKIVILLFDLLVTVYDICAVLRSSKDEYHLGLGTNVLALSMAVGATILILNV